jgi:hypothetical protein
MRTIKSMEENICYHGVGVGGSGGFFFVSLLSFVSAIHWTAGDAVYSVAASAAWYLCHKAGK